MNSTTSTDKDNIALSYLIIDDDAPFRDALSQALSRQGNTVFTAADSASGVSTAIKEKPQRIVLDLMLGQQENGLQCIEPLLKALPTADILILTGYSSIATAVNAIKMGARNYLAKPARVSEILDAFAEQRMDEPGISVSMPSVKRLEWEHIQRALADNDGNVSATARALGMHRRTLQRKLQKKPVQQ